MHQNRSKRQKCDVNYLELNIDKSTPQPKSKSKTRTKKIDIVAALREPSKTRLAAYQVQKERQHSNPGDVIGTIIKTEVKSEVKMELDRINTRHKYKNIKFPVNVNYIHADGTPCRSARKKANELLDLPTIEDTPQSTNNGLTAETPSQTIAEIISKHKTSETKSADKLDPTPHNGLHVETATEIEQTDRTTESDRNLNDRLTVEMEINKPNTYSALIIRNVNKINENNSALQVETVKNNGALQVETTKGTSGSTRRDTKNDNNKDSEDSTASEAALGLIMLQEHDPTENTLLQKYDNSSLLPIDAARQVDYSINPDTERADIVNNEDFSYNSDDTIILQQEIEDTIVETANDYSINTSSLTKTRQYPGLPVETDANESGLYTSNITKGLSKLTVSQPPTATAQTPVSPNKGTVVFKSYRLRRHVADNDDETGNSSTSKDASHKPTPENDIQLAKIPSGNSTRPPPPDKYKIRKFQIDKVCYYTCLYCNKHFESIQYLNKHHRSHHPPVSCDVCKKMYDTPNSLIRHSYTHLGGNHQCDQCQELFHFKSELDSHKNKHSNRRFQCNKCDKSFIRNSDLNAHLDTHGQKWKCSYKGCNKECADKHYLTTHMKIHSNELKYPCRMCKK